MIALRDIDLIENFTRRGYWLNKDGLFVGDGIGHAVQVMDGEREKFPERSRVLHDSEHGARGAVAAEAACAPIAVSTSKIDFAGYPTSDPLVANPGDRYHFAYELMSRSSGEAIVSTLQFEIGGTYSGG